MMDGGAEGKRTKRRINIPESSQKDTKSVEGVRKDDNYYYQLKINENANAIKTKF